MSRPIPEGVVPPEGCVILGWGDTFKVPEDGFQGWRIRPGNKEWLECWKWFGGGVAHIYAAPADSEVARLNTNPSQISTSAVDPKDALIRELVGALQREVDNCPICAGQGSTADSLDHLLGNAKPDERIECTRCKTSRSTLTLARTTCPEAFESKLS